MRLLLVTLLVISSAVTTLACTGERPAAPPPQPAHAAQEQAAQPALPARREFPERAADLTPRPAPRPKAPKAAVEPPREAPAPVAVPAGPPPLPFTYVGKLVEGGERSAVLARDQAIFVVRPGDSLAGRYRVEAVREEQVLLLNLEFGVVQPLAFSGPPLPGATPSPPLAKPKAIADDDASLRLAGPSQVAVGEQFTLTVSLDAGASALPDGGSVEVRFDPKVLQLRGNEGESAVNGAAQIEVSGASTGQPAMVRFRVIAQAPTATEIRVVPMAIVDGDGNNLRAETSAAHGLVVVRR